MSRCGPLLFLDWWDMPLGEHQASHPPASASHVVPHTWAGPDALPARHPGHHAEGEEAGAG